MNWETLLCIGDSITIGARSYLGYPEYAGFELENKLSKHWNVINKSTSGMTTIDICRAMDNDFQSLKALAPSIITILSGTNDAKTNVNVDDFYIAYSGLITKSRLLSSHILLIRIPMFTKGIMYPYTIEMNDTIKAYNECIEKLARKNSVRVLDIEWQDEWLFDGVHLNAAGSKAVGLALAEYILRDKGIEG